MSISGIEKNYQKGWIGAGYDFLSHFVFAPVGGLERVRAETVEAMQLGRGTSVLELGCGTGGMTALLVARGADVVAVDWSEPMLGRARRRAPRASFVRAEISNYEPTRTYDRVLFSFVLHELEPDARRRALEVARRALRDDGVLVVVDHDRPTRGLLPRAMSAFVHAFEPPSAAATSADRVEIALEEAGFSIGRRASLARGIAFSSVATPRSRASIEGRAVATLGS